MVKGYLFFSLGVLLALAGALLIYIDRVLEVKLDYYHLVVFSPITIGLIITAIGLRWIGLNRKM